MTPQTSPNYATTSHVDYDVVDDVEVGGGHRPPFVDGGNESEVITSRRSDAALSIGVLSSKKEQNHLIPMNPFRRRDIAASFIPRARAASAAILIADLPFPPTSTTNTIDMEIPDSDTISSAAKLDVLNVNGEKVAFGTLFEKQKTIVVFIRGRKMQAYVEGLASVSKEALRSANVKIVVIGCGEWKPIRTYAEKTNMVGSIFADPSRALFHTLGMNIENLDGTPAGQDRRGYLKQAPLLNAMQSIWNGPLKNPSLIGKQGNISQLGGEFIFGPGLQCNFAARMKHTEDHIEIPDLLKEAGVEA
ncbi:AhpC/TSA antioxidant enzyme-domain-containing protein [Lyophyllum atratum]|nr:AhpC/TSA antioxidant enzyme-domain-containing protein [Lyophyllum atratum]